MATPAITKILDAARDGDPAATSELLPLVYDELRRLAHAEMAHEPDGHTLQPTALVHEAYLRLVDSGGRALTWRSRGHFFAVAAQAMRRILVDRARGRHRLKRGGDRRRELLSENAGAVDPNEPDLVELDAALERFERHDAERARIVMLRYFGGLTIDETAAAMEMSVTSVKADWNYARAWLHRELSGSDRRGDAG